MISHIHTISENELKSFIVRLGSMPIECLAFRDFAGSFEMSQAHVWRLENGQYALIVEDGCSCYDSNEADIDLFPTVSEAVDKYQKWVKKQYKDRRI